MGKQNQNNQGNATRREYVSIFDDASVELDANSNHGNAPIKGKRRSVKYNTPASSGQPHYNADDARRQDAYDLRDYMTQLSNALNKAYNTLGSIASDGYAMNVVESQLNPQLSEVANTIFNIMNNYFSKVVASKSDFYSAAYKVEARRFLDTNKAVATDQRNGGVDARAIRMFFSTLSPMMLSQEFTNIDFEFIETFDDAIEVIDYYRYTKFFTPWNTDPSAQNGFIDAENDTRGEVDINLEYYLQFLVVTPYLKNKLKTYGVSESLLSAMGNFILPANAGQELTATTFKDITDTMYGNNDKWMKRFAGSAYAKDIQLDLIKWVEAFRVKASRILATTADANGIVHNLYNADLAVKLWMQGAMNAVWKVLVEDAAGAMDRVNSSIARNTADFLPAFIPDIVALLANTNNYYFKEAVDDAKALMSNKSIYFNPTVYQFLKDRFAPNITIYDSRTDRFIDTTKLPARKYQVRIIPKLVLPINPFDSYCKWVTEHELHANTPVIHDKDNVPTKAGEEGDRSPFFTCIKLPDAYLDQRSKTVFVNLTMYFDNMLSYALQVCTSAAQYNPRSSFAKLMTNSDLEEEDSDGIFSLANPSSANNRVMGPWVKYTAIGNDLVASCQDRYAIMGYMNTVHGTSIHPLYCAASSRKDGDFTNIASTKDAESAVDTAKNAPKDAIISCLEYHTNPLALRMLSICRYMKEMPAMITRRSIVNNQLEYFIRGVLDGDESLHFSKSNSFGGAVHQCSSNKIGDLKPQHYFRYSVINEGGKAYLFDNASCSQGKKMVLLRSVAAAKLPTGRSIHYAITNQQNTGNKFNDATNLLSIMLPSDGSIFGIDGMGYHAVAELGDAHCIAQLTGADGSLADIDSTAFSCNRTKHEVLPVFIIPKTITSGKYASYSYGSGWNVFTKRMDVQSEFMLDGTVAPTFDTPMCLSDTIWQSEKLSDNSLMRWARQLSAWNKSNAMEVIQEAETIIFDSIVKQVFAPFSTWKPNVYDIYLPASFVAAGGTVADVAASDRISMIRYSCSCAFALGNGNPGDKAWEASNDISILPYMMLDICRFHNITSIGLLAQNKCWANHETTESIKRLLKIFVVDECSKFDYNYCKSRLHGQVVPLKRSVALIDERAVTYKSWIPKINGAEGDF